MSTITVDPSENTVIVIPGLCRIFATDSGFHLTPEPGLQCAQIADGLVFSRSQGPVLPLLSEKLEEAAMLAYMGGRPAVTQLQDRLALLLLNHPEARVANSIRPHADVIPYRWADRRAPQVPEVPRNPGETVGYVFYTRDGQAVTSSIWDDGTLSSGVLFDWPAEAGSL